MQVQGVSHPYWFAAALVALAVGAFLLGIFVGREFPRSR